MSRAKSAGRNHCARCSADQSHMAMLLVGCIPPRRRPPPALPCGRRGAARWRIAFERPPNGAHHANGARDGRRRRGRGALDCGLRALPLLSALAVAASLGAAQGDERRPYHETAAVVARLAVDQRGSCRPPAMVAVVRHRAEFFLVTPADGVAPMTLGFGSPSPGDVELQRVRTTPLACDERYNFTLHQVPVPTDARLANRLPAALDLALDRSGERREVDWLLAVDAELPPPLWSAIPLPTRAEARGWYQHTRSVDAPPGAHLGLGAPVLRGGQRDGLLGVVAELEHWEKPPFAPLPAWAGVIDLGHADHPLAPPGPAQGTRGAVVVTSVFGAMLDHLIDAARRAPAGPTATRVELPEPGFALDDEMRVSRIHTVGPERRAGVTLGDRLLRVNDAAVASPQDVLDAYLRAGSQELELRLQNDLWAEDRSVRVRPQSGDERDRAHLAAAGLSVAREPSAGALLVTDVFSARGVTPPLLGVGSHLLGGVVDVPLVVRQRFGGDAGGLELARIEWVRRETDFAGSRARLVAWLTKWAAPRLPACLRVRGDDGWVARVPREQWQRMADIVRANVAGR